MNKPAPKEPSMDEILSSIRQIIADDDAGAVPRKPAPIAATPQPPARSFAPAPPRPAEAPAKPDVAPEPEPLALSPEQILGEDEPSIATDAEQDFMAQLVDDDPLTAALVEPEDIAFEPMPEPEPVFSPPPRPVSPAPAPRLPPRPVAQAAPLPDPNLTADMAEELLEPTTQSVVRSTFAKLNNMSAIGSNVTIEQMMREMLRPMLKEWLDENLPAVVERIVEQEIARVSRGGR